MSDQENEKERGKDIGPPWIDVVTMAMPRLTTEICITSFLECMEDRRDFRLRWIFCLDRPPPNRLHYARFYERNLDIARFVSQHFDDSLILTTDENRGYGGSVRACLERVRHRVAWVEDDKLWSRRFSMAKTLDTSDGGKRFVFWPQYEGHKRTIRRWRGQGIVCHPGATCPGLWADGAPQFLLQNFPPVLKRVSEMALIYIVKFHGGYESAYYDEEWYSRDLLYCGSHYAKRYLDEERGVRVRFASYQESLDACGWKP